MDPVYEPCNSKYMKNYVRYNCGINPITREQLPPTCRLEESMIINITYFLCNIIPKNNNEKILISDIKSGEIINKGSFGYTFALKTDIIIKIIVCLPNLGNMIDMLRNEINIHSILSKYDTINYIQLYGYYMKKDDNKYYYYDIPTNTEKKIDLDLDKEKTFSDSCEIYLLMHKGLKDVASYIGRIFDDNTLTTFIQDAQDIYDLLNAFKVSNKILENEGKIFIHLDIKAENIVRAEDITLKKYNLKLIDFGLSKLSNTFFINSSDGTEYVFKLLFTYKIINQDTKIFIRELYDNRLSMVSPLFDIFSIILVMFELFIKYRLNTTEYNINKINEIMIEYAYVKKNKYNNSNLYMNIRRLLIIFNSIYDFHQDRIKQYYENALKSDSIIGWLKGFVSKDPLQTYIESFDMKDFTLSDIDGINIPKYIVSGNKLKDDMKYVTNLIDFVMTLNIE